MSFAEDIFARFGDILQLSCQNGRLREFLRGRSRCENLREYEHSWPMKNWKINIATLLCAALVFQVVAINFLGLIPFSKNEPFSTKTILWALKKKQTQVEAPGRVETAEYPFAEVREEEKTLETSPWNPIQMLYSPLVHIVSSKLNRILPTDQYYSHFSSCRYITLQVFRT